MTSFLSTSFGLLECMSVGLNVIATDYSAHTEFAESANCRLVHVDETEPARTGEWFWGDRNWAKLGPSQMEQMVHHLRGYRPPRTDRRLSLI
jgi:hypothetical protein